MEQWFRLLDKYEIVPVEYGHWIDSRLFAGRELTTKEPCEMLIRDIVPDSGGSDPILLLDARS